MRKIATKPRTNVIDAIRKRRIRDEIRRVSKTGKLTSAIQAELKDPSTRMEVLLQIFDEVCMEQTLKSDGLYKEELEEVLFSQFYAEETKDWLLERKEHENNVLGRGTFLGEDDFTENDRIGGSSSAPNLPGIAVSDFWELMRPPPKSLLHQIARNLTETGFFETDQKVLHVGVLMFSRHVEDDEHFDDIMTGGIGKHVPGFTFVEFKASQISLKRLFREKLKNFFRDNHSALLAVRKRTDLNQSKAQDIWARFRKVWDSLTTKQKHALEKVYMQSEPMTYERAASDFKISVDSLRDRIRGAFEKYETEFPEFRSFQHGLKEPRSENRKPTESQLFSVDPLTGEKTPIDPKSPTLKSLSPKQIAEIKAKAIEATPMPMFSETEYFE